MRGDCCACIGLLYKTKPFKNANVVAIEYDGMTLNNFKKNTPG